MFVLTKVVDTVRIPPHLLGKSTPAAIHNEIDMKYCNRVIIDVGLVICRYGPCLKIGDGVCVSGDGGSHHECLFQLVIFKPFVEEVMIGKVLYSTPDGIQVTLGNFFQDIFIPPYWMLRISTFNEETGLWVWTEPNYDEDEEEEEEEKEDGEKEKDGKETSSNNGSEQPANGNKVAVKQEVQDEQPNSNGKKNNEEKAEDGEEGGEGEEEEEGEDEGLVLDIGAEIRFRVKSINFTQVTNTAKGIQAKTTTTSHMTSLNKSQKPGEKGGKADSTGPVRERSLSVDINENKNVPATMHIVASICEDGLGLTSWWTNPDEDGEEEGEEEQQGEGEEIVDDQGHYGEGEYYEEEY